MAYLTIAEAIEKFGKSESSYRRLIREIRKGSDGAKRRLIKPSEKEIAELRSKGEPYTYTVSEELIQPESRSATSEPEQGSDNESSTEVAGPQWFNKVVEKMEERHDKEVARLEKQLEEERKAAAAREARIQKYAEKDKERFAKASENMTQALATAKSLTQNLLVSPGATPDADKNKSDVIPGASHPKQGSAAESAKPKKGKQEKSSTKTTRKASKTDAGDKKSDGFWRKIFDR